MHFFLRNISISILVLTIVMVSFAVYLSGRVVYETILNQVLQERIMLVEVLGKTALEGSSQVGVEDTLTRVGKREPGIIFFRVVDIQTRQILESAQISGETHVVDRELPLSKRGSVSLEVDKLGERSIVELSYLGGDNKLLWMAIDQSFFVNPAIVAGVKQAFLLVSVFGVFAFIFYGIIRKFFMRPVRQLKNTLTSLEAGDTDKKDTPQISKEGFGDLLESFSGVTQRIESTIEHDKVISQSKSDFISTTAHQLRTPLSGINWALGGLLSSGENFTDEQRTLLQRSLEKTKELVTIVGELLSAAGIEQGKFGFHREEVALKEEIEQTIAEEQQTAMKNDVTLHFEHTDEEFPMVYVDRERIRWVVRNLIENAIRYGKKGGNVHISLAKDSRKLSVSVKDDGIGITPEAQRHIFEKFFRSTEAKKKRNDGSGLGLFIVKNIVNYHGGRIWFESVEGVGTTFFFTVPVGGALAQKAKT